MARHEADREDLLAEGVNLPQRGRVIRNDDARTWIIGWRKETAMSLFVDADPVFQFNTLGQLRRVFLDGQKLAARCGVLTRLQQISDPNGRLVFQHSPLSEVQHAEVQARLFESARELLELLKSGNFSVETIGIDTPALLSRVVHWCDTHGSVEIAATPNIE